MIDIVFNTIIDLITDNESITIQDIANETGIPVETIKAVLDEITEDLNINVIGKTEDASDELNEYLNEWDRWNGPDDDPDGSLAEAQLKELNDIWDCEVGCVFGR